MKSIKVALDLISLADPCWYSFTNEWYEHRELTLWQAIALVMMEEGVKDEVIEEYWNILRAIEAEVTDEILAEIDTYYDEDGNVYSTEILPDVRVEDRFLKASDADEYLSLLNCNRVDAVVQMTLPHIIYSLLLAEIERHEQGLDTVLNIKKPAVMCDPVSHFRTISKASLSKWKELPSVIDLGLVDKLLRQPTKSLRADKIENYQRVTGILVHLLARLLPEQITKKVSGSVNIHKLVKFVSLNVDRSAEDFPQDRTINNVLTQSYSMAKASINQQSPVVLSESSSSRTVLDEPPVLKTRNEKLPAIKGE